MSLFPFFLSFFPFWCVVWLLLLVHWLAVLLYTLRASGLGSDSIANNCFFPPSPPKRAQCINEQASEKQRKEESKKEKKTGRTDCKIGIDISATTCAVVIVTRHPVIGNPRTTTPSCD